ncbi:MAG: hypothetical protein NVS3B14_10760 [Ktedonobacteraceae bacterium]
MCLVSLTFGTTRLSHLVTYGWRRIHTFRPGLVGGCQPVELLNFLPETQWQRDHAKVVTAFGAPSEVVVALKRRARDI